MSDIQSAQTAKGPGWHIHYTVQCQVPALILLLGGGPGATGTSIFSKNLLALSEHFRFYAIEFPGWGLSW